MATAMMLRTLFLMAPGAVVLAACSTPGGDRYPSLAIRDVERAEGQFEPVESSEIDVPPVETDLTGPLGQRLAALVAQAEEAHAGFAVAVPSASRIVEAAAGSDVASDRWAAAQVALADLDSARSLTAVPLGDLDTLFIAATVESAERTAILGARDRVIALVAEEDAVLERLRARVP